MNKYKTIIIICFLITITSISKTYAIVNGYNLLGKVIYLDPGHGGIDSGATYYNIYEKDINLTLSKKLAESLISKGATVYLTRETDCDLATTKINRKRSDLANRAYLINKSDADIYISIHLNYINGNAWKGLQIFYNDKLTENKVLADSLTSYLKEKTSNIRKPKYENNYYMYKRINKPGVLIEVGFLSNANDRYRLTHEEYQNQIIENISYSIEKYFLQKD